MNKKIMRRSNDIEETQLHAHPVLNKIYAQRGIRTAEELEHDLKNLHPYTDLLGVEQAAELLYAMFQAQKRILIIGDFDADGATSSALAVLALRKLGAQNVFYLVPNRFEYGYGLTPEIVDVAKTFMPDLIITVDNGIASVPGVVYAKQLNIKVLITDHHLPPEILPPAEVIVNPNQRGCTFPSKNLAGVGVIFYVLLALRSLLRKTQWFSEQKIPEVNMADFLDLVAVGTVADVVPLDQNNRILVAQGLKRIRQGQCRPGILALLALANRNYKNITATDLGFVVGPRLNAAGRLDDMSMGIECLLAAEANSAQNYAQTLQELNQERRSIEQGMQNQARKVLTKINKDNLAICLFDETWHQGVIGILAGRIKDQFHRPVIVFAPGTDDEEIKGSARSISGFHIRDALATLDTQYPQLIEKFGGHAMAAGLTLKKANFTTFAACFTQVVTQQLDNELLHHHINSDGELNAQDLNLNFAEAIRGGGPWGQSFPEPIFDGRFRILQQRLVGFKHLKLTLQHPDGTEHEAICFNVNVDEWPNNRCEYVHAAYRLDINEYRGMRRVQLVIEHLEACT